VRPCRPERNLVPLRDHELHPRRVVSVRQLETDLDDTISDLDLKLPGRLQLVCVPSKISANGFGLVKSFSQFSISWVHTDNDCCGIVEQSSSCPMTCSAMLSAVAIIFLFMETPAVLTKHQLLTKHQ
jgi:hypothetical protein